MNRFKFASNSARAACGIKTFAPLPAFASKTLTEKIKKQDDDLVRLNKELAKWLAPEAEAAIKKIRQDAHDDPTDENLAKLSAESIAELTKRYADAANEIRNIIAAKVRSGGPLMAEVLEGATPLLEEEMNSVEAANKAQAERYGVTYDRENDQTLKSLARLSENLRAQLEGPVTDEQKHAFSRGHGSAATPERLREMIGTLKPKSGLFSL
jgi:hypothetical protein